MQQDQLVIKVKLEPKDHKDLKEILVLLEIKVKLDLKDHKDLLVLLVKKVQPEKKVIKVIQDLQDLKVQPGLLVLMVSQYLLKEVLIL